MVDSVFSRLCFLPRMSACRRDFDESKCMSFLRKDDEFLEKYNEIWKKVENSIKKEFGSEPVYNEKYLKAKMKSYNGKISTDFLNTNRLKEGSQFTHLSEILVDSVFRTGKYIVKEKKMPEYITEMCVSILSDGVGKPFSVCPAADHAN